MSIIKNSCCSISFKKKKKNLRPAACRLRPFDPSCSKEPSSCDDDEAETGVLEEEADGDDEEDGDDDDV